VGVSKRPVSCSWAESRNKGATAPTDTRIAPANAPPRPSCRRQAEQYYFAASISSFFSTSCASINAATVIVTEVATGIDPKKWFFRMGAYPVFLPITVLPIADVKGAPDKIHEPSGRED
jgi:hypothetical protein